MSAISFRHVTVTFLLSVLVSCLAAPGQAQFSYSLENAFPRLQFDRPVDLAGDGLGSLYVVEQPGRIFAFPNDSTTQDTTVFLDLREAVYYDEAEAGLLSLSFHPSYEENGYAYVYYVLDDPLRSRLSRFERSMSDPRAADPGSEVVILEVEQPTPRHNAGDTSFGPDGYLYLSLGDGSRGGDAYDHAQNLKTLLGSILRIDVDRPAPGMNYGIPPDNPLVGNGNGYREEIFAYGFRNPWRFSVDPVTGHLWAADVGEQSWEEVDFVVSGGNYGWPRKEGPACFEPDQDCDMDGLAGPVHAYDRDTGSCITGGFVYRGERLPELRGKYIFADWSGRQIWALTYEGTDSSTVSRSAHVEQIADGRKLISSFGVDENEELYVLYTFQGTVMRFREATVSGADDEPPLEDRFTFELTGPNPFSRSTQFVLRPARTADVTVTAYDALGREVGVLFDAAVQAGAARDISLDAGALPNGVYIVRAQAGGQSVSRRVVLTR